MKYCESLLNELTFYVDEIKPCCSPYAYRAPQYIADFSNNIETKKANIKKQIEQLNLSEKQREIIKNLNENPENYSCSKCIFLKDEEENEINSKNRRKYNSIFLRHWTECNANCIHCDNHRDNTYGQKALYNPYEIIKKAYENNLIDTQNLIVRFQGGDIGVLPEFEQFVDLFTKYGYKTIHFSTNNIVYQPKIEAALRAGKGSLNISLDCGTRATYEKIKRTDKFNECIENLKTYLSKGINPSCITIHYIIIQGYNDNKNEIKAFINTMKKIGIKKVGVRIDHKDLNAYLRNEADKRVINKYKQLITYFYNEAKRNEFSLDNDSCIEQNFVLSNNNKSGGILKKLTTILRLFAKQK